MSKRTWRKLLDRIAIFYLENELDEQLNYRDNLVKTIRTAPSELQISNQKIADLKLALGRLRGRVGVPAAE